VRSRDGSSSSPFEGVSEGGHGSPKGSSQNSVGHMVEFLIFMHAAYGRGSVQRFLEWPK